MKLIAFIIRRHLGGFLSFVCLLSSVPLLSAQRDEKELISFNDSAVLKHFATTGAKLEYLPALGSRKAAMKIVGEGSGPARIKLIPNSASSWNWAGFSALGVEIENLNDAPMSINISLIEAGEKTPRKASNAGELGPHSRFAFAIPIGRALPMSRGMRGGPTIAGYIPPPFTVMEPIDETKIAAMEISFQAAQPGQSLAISGLKLLPMVSYEKIVDRFGQYTRMDWPGKIHNERELVEQGKNEEAELKRLPSLPDRDEFGGWSSGPQLPRRGFFSTYRQAGKWWLVTPSGHLFLSFGVNTIHVNAAQTLINGREDMFTWLPGEKDPLARQIRDEKNIRFGPIREGKSFDFYQANLQRKYGEDYLLRFFEMVNKRLRSWGFTTIANWSDRHLCALHKIPYTATLTINGDFARVSSGVDFWAKMSDPFDTRFREAVRRNLTEQSDSYRDDPWCIGYFIDNEVSWGDDGSDQEHFALALSALKEEIASPAKQALISLLKHRYPSLEALNQGWGTQFKSWDLIVQDSSLPDLKRERTKADLSAFLTGFARQYFRVIKESLAETDPNHLYLGCRFAWRTPEAVQAAAEFCDVVSFNIYERKLTPAKWHFTLKLDKPCIIGEFHFGAVDRGMFHTGLVAAHGQKERGQMYIDYIRSIVDHPAFVGCHWFQYMDEPLTGRAYDGENFCIGMVDVTDSPYPELITAARQAHTEAHVRRAEKH